MAMNTDAVNWDALAKLPRNAAIIRELRSDGVIPACIQPLPMDGEFPADAKDERVLQKQAEMWLCLRGYQRLTSENAEKVFARTFNQPIGPRGWFGHWSESKRNPIMPDLLVLPYPLVRRRALMLELKAAGGAPVWRPGQKEMVDIGMWQIARSLQEVCEIVREWEDE